MSKSNRRFLIHYILILFLPLPLFLSVYAAVTCMYRQDIREDCLKASNQAASYRASVALGHPAAE